MNESLPNNTILNLSKLKAFGNDKVNVNSSLDFGFGRVEKIVGKGENAGYQNFPLSQLCFFFKFCFLRVIIGRLW